MGSREDTIRTDNLTDPTLWLGKGDQFDLKNPLGDSKAIIGPWV